MDKKYYFLILLGIGSFLLFPTDSFNAEAYTPIGENIWFILNPPTETRLGGVFAAECPICEN